MIWDELKNALSFVRGCETAKDVWPRVISYTFKVYDFKTDTFAQEEKTITIKKKPLRIIPHAVGVAEILWAICPRERLVAFNEFSADPDFSFIADEVRAARPDFSNQSRQNWSSAISLIWFLPFFIPVADFKEKLKAGTNPLL